MELNLVLFAVIFIAFASSFHHTRNLNLSRYSTKLFNKVKVRLLTDVKGQGKKGEIVLVSPAMWTNVLSPNKQGITIGCFTVKSILRSKLRVSF